MSEITTALYRKYRPSTFAEVRNQDHIVRVLEGALKKGSIPHALLFTGPRGTGKTTIARIFARALGASEMDIYEIDAASNRGIDDIRSLKEAVHTLPYESVYKVYIIDEVHMLTKEAFNALLKTLEEPPAHVVFILATTEKDKLLDTITSRCQTFTFNAPSPEELRDTVLLAAKKEKFSLHASGAAIIARAAQGSYRDALGILQKVILASDDRELEADEIASIVGAPRTSILIDLLLSFGTKDRKKGIEALEQARKAQTDVSLLYILFLSALRHVLLLRYKERTEEEILEQFGSELCVCMRTCADDLKSPINSHLLSKILGCAPYIGKNGVGTLPLEVVLYEHCE